MTTSAPVSPPFFPGFGPERPPLRLLLWFKPPTGAWRVYQYDLDDPGQVEPVIGADAADDPRLAAVLAAKGVTLADVARRCERWMDGAAGPVFALVDLRGDVPAWSASIPQ